MMLFWVLAAVLAAATVGALLCGLRNSARRTPAVDPGLTVYRAQLDEVDRDVSRGVLTAPEAARVRTEIGRRILAHAGDGPPEPRSTTAGVGARRLALAVTVAVPLAAIALYLAWGAPERPAMPLQGRLTAPLETMVARGDAAALAARLRTATDDAERLALAEGLAASLAALERPGPEGWLLVGDAFLQSGRVEDGLAALRTAHRAADGQRADIATALGSALAWAAGGRIVPEALAALETAHRLDPTAPQPMILLGDARFQAGDDAAALTFWRRARAALPPGADWLEGLDHRILVASAGQTGPASGAAADGSPGPRLRDDVAAAAAMMAPQEQQAYIRSMVDGLAARLARSPEDPEGWLRLARAYEVLGEPDRAAAALAEAADHLPDSESVQLTFARRLADDAWSATPPAPLPPAARAAFEAVLAINPDNPEALWHLALADVRSGDGVAAVHRLRRLLALLPPDSPAYAEAAALLQTVGGG